MANKLNELLDKAEALAKRGQEKCDSLILRNIEYFNYDLLDLIRD